MKLPVGYVEGLGQVKPTAYGGFGERLLKEMGWERGTGLGKSGQGMKEALSVKQKDDTLGIGASGSWNWEDKWWERAFDSAAQTLTDRDTGAGPSSTTSDSSSSEDEGDAIQVSTSVRSNRDGTLSSASAQELRLLSSLSKGGGRLAAGRFGGRAAKMARIREQEAKMAAASAAKLGIQLPSSDASDSTTTGTISQHTGGPCRGISGSESDTGRKMKRTREISQEKSIEKPQARRRIVIEPKVEVETVRKDIKVHRTSDHGWWGASMFVSAGCVESLEKLQRRPRGFSESDQTNIFNAAHKGKAQGRVGLGQGTGAVKVGGVTFCGKKVTFEEEVSDGGDDDGTENNEVHAHIVRTTASSTRLIDIGDRPDVDTIEQEKRSSEQSSARNGNAATMDLNWRKMMVKALKLAPSKELKGKLLRKEVAKIVQSNRKGITIEKKVVKCAIKEVLENDSKGKFIVRGKWIRLN